MKSLHEELAERPDPAQPTPNSDSTASGAASALIFREVLI
jgi:hypothetical protein